MVLRVVNDSASTRKTTVVQAKAMSQSMKAARTRLPPTSVGSARWEVLVTGDSLAQGDAAG